MRLRHFAAAALVTVLSAGPALAATWTGWITDEHCGAKGAKADHKECAEKCHSKGIPFVFYDTADKKIYKIDNQDLAGQNLGHAVTVTGTLEGDQIKVEKIEAAPQG
jgi:hypothetical protein